MNTANRPVTLAWESEREWTQIKETVRMLHLSVAQIEMAMRDGDESVNTLSNSFTSMAGSVEVIAQAAQELPEAAANLRGGILTHCAKVSAQMHATIIAFQFYDMLSQRLSHVSHSLEAMAELLDDGQRLHSPFEWQALQQKIRSRYSMRIEQEMFDALLKGASIPEALALVARSQAEEERGADDDIELF